jgi:hypothetical protein
MMPAGRASTVDMNRKKLSPVNKRFIMADGSEMLTYLLYAVLVIVLAVAGWYIGNQWQYKQVGAVVGGLIGASIVYWHSSSSSSSSYSF